MRIDRVCTREVVTIRLDESVTEAARRMRDRNVGDLVVVDRTGGFDRPVAVLTDRDLVVGVLARDVDHLKALDVRDVIRDDVVVARDHDEVDAVAERMRKRSIRRVPVVDARGALVGIFTLDDALARISAELSRLATVVAQQPDVEKHRRP